MAVKRVIVARLHNLGNYENIRFECESTVEGGDVAAAWSAARQACAAAFTAFEADREAEERRAQEEREARYKAQREEDERRRQERLNAQGWLVEQGYQTEMSRSGHEYLRFRKDRSLLVVYHNGAVLLQGADTETPRQLLDSLIGEAAETVPF